MTFLIILTVCGVGLILPVLATATATIMTVANIDEKNRRAYLSSRIWYFSTLAYPVLAILALVLAWIAYASDAESLARGLALVPLGNFVLGAVAMFFTFWRTKK